MTWVWTSRRRRELSLAILGLGLPVVVPGRAPAFLLGDDLGGVVQLGNSAQVVILVYERVAEVGEGTASVAFDVLNVFGGHVELCVIVSNFRCGVAGSGHAVPS